MYTDIAEEAPKPVRWIGSAKCDLKAFPRPVQRDMGQALYAVQCGEEYPSVKTLKGLGGRPARNLAPFLSCSGDPVRAHFPKNCATNLKPTAA
jgi:hypothetical protein